jgi:hypothetical protein
METHIYSTEDLKDWYEYYDRLPAAGAYHNPDYLALLEGEFEFDSEQAELFVLEDQDAFVYYPYLKRPLSDLSFDHPDYNLDAIYDIVSSWYYGGPLLSAHEKTELAETFASEFTQHCRDTGIVAEFIRFDPNIRNYEQFGVLDPIDNRQTVPVDLSKSQDRIWDEFSSSNRTHIRQAREAGFEVEPATTSAEVGAFHDIYSAAMEAKGASKHYRFSQDFFERFLFETPNLATLLLSRYDGEIVGGSFLVHDTGTVNEYLRASEPELWDLGLNNHLCCEAIDYMHDQGYDRLDFQGGRPGVFDFKKSFSPERGEFKIAKRVHDEFIYQELVDRASDAGVDTDTGYFPAYRIEQSN